ncbi:MAG: DUF4405 domain-containing protein [bacterium]
MSKHRLHLVVNVVSYVVLAALVGTGLIMAYRLPPGTGGRHSGEPALTLLGRSRHEWGDVHWALAIAFIALMVLHVVLHWKWVTNAFGALAGARKPKGPGAGTGGTVLLVVLGLVAGAVIAAPLLIGVEREESVGRGQRERVGAGARKGEAAPGQKAGTANSPAVERGPGRRKPGAGAGAREGRGHGESDSAIRGRNTLAEAAQAAGVPVQRLIAALELPAHTDPQTRLGHLRRERGFEMHEVRDVVERLKQAPAPPR